MYIQYSKPLRFGEGDFTPGGLRASVLLHAFQDIAGEHANSAGLGFDDLMARDLIWVITKSRFRILGEPRPGEDYTLLTFPRRTTSMIYDRDFYLLDGGGERVVIGTSAWCVVNAVTRHVMQTDITFKGEHTPEKSMPEGILRIRPRDLEPAGTHTVTEADLDGNMHTNNCRYADMALGVLGLSSVRELTMNFANETRLGDTIELLRGDGVAAGKRDGELVFAAKVC